MAYIQKRVVSLFFLQLAFLAVSNLNQADGQTGLKTGYYEQSCPDAETIAYQTVHKFISRDKSIAAPLLRLHFHDCFVRGCDGSVLLNSSKKNEAEKDAGINFSLRGFQVIDAVKSAIEKRCPGVVSCADILALAARDAVVMTGGSYWEVPMGRRDGRVSRSSDVFGNLPLSRSNITELKHNFASKGLTTKDLVVLSGGHTIGVSHCAVIERRLNNFTGKGDTDPSLDPHYATLLKQKCKPDDADAPGVSRPVVALDPGSSKTFDANFYRVVMRKRGLLGSDAALLDDPETRDYVKWQSVSGGITFGKDFGESMVKMGEIEVLTGEQGEIRKHCAFVN